MTPDACPWPAQWRWEAGVPANHDPFAFVSDTLHKANEAYDADDAHAERKLYHAAAAAIVAHPGDFSGVGADAGARVLWKLYLSVAGEAYRPQANRLRSSDARDFFEAMIADSAHFTSGHPDDADAATALRNGAAAGARGDLRAAARFFAGATATYSTAYIGYASGAAEWLMGDRAGARQDWLCGSDAGTNLPPGDVAFNSFGNIASVTMLLSL